MTMRKAMPDDGVEVVMRVLVGAVVVAMLVAGCSSPTEEPTPSPSPTEATVSASPTPSVDAEAAQRAQDEAAVRDVYDRYWAAVVQVQAGTIDQALFDGVAAGPVVEQEIAQANQMHEFGLVRQGAPTFSEVTVTVEGDAATVLACVDNSAWVVPDVADDLPDVLPGGVAFDRVDGSWLVTGIAEAPADFTC